MRNITFSKGSFIATKTARTKKQFYWTIVNTKPPTRTSIDKHMFHCHIFDASLANAAKMLCIWAHNIESGKTAKWPWHYPLWMQRGLSRLLYGDLDMYKKIWKKQKEA